MYQLLNPHGKYEGAARPSRQDVKVLSSLSDTGLRWVTGDGWVTLEDCTES